MGLLVLLLSLAQGGPWPALAAIGRGVGVIKPATPTPASDVLPIWQVPTTPTPALGQGSDGRSTTTPPSSTDDLKYNKLTTWSFGDEPRIDAMRPMIVMTLKERELAFNGTSGRVLSFYPGEGNQKLHGRDLSTLLSTAQYLYPDDYLRSGIEEILIRQYGEQTRSDAGDSGVVPGAGALPGIVAPDGSIEKETVTSDEETSAIHAAYQYYKVSGATWLKKDLGGRSVLDRLNSAIEWLYNNRFDATHHLIKRGHTTDWGNIKFERGVDASDFDPKVDHWTASIYDQAMTFRALRELAEMNQASGREDRAKTLLARADDLRQATNSQLWMPERGYYRLHIHLTALTHTGFEEDDIVSIGNAVAVFCGLTTSEQERAIFRRLEETRLLAEARKPGQSLYPPYPPNFFATTQRKVNEYQNGGLWDWWGGIQVLAEFNQGYTDLALAHLYLVAADWALHPNVIWEWSQPNSAFGRGASGFAGAAGTVGDAIISGLYGVSMGRDGIRVEPRLGTHNGEMRVYQAASDRYIAYRYTYSQDTITLRYGTNTTADVSFRVLIPGGRAVRSVLIGSTDLTPRRESTGDDVFAAFKGPTGSNTIIITLGPAAPGGVGPAIDPIFYDYYSKNDGRRLLGAPLTAAIMEGAHLVQYFERAKIEDRRQTSKDSVWQFSYGLMGEDLLRSGAKLPVGGITSTVTYATLQGLAAESKRVAPPKGFTGGTFKKGDGSIFIPFTSDLSPAPGHNVAPIFWVVLSSDTRSPGGWYHDIGLPLTEPVWATVDRGDGKSRRVQIQAFQRTILIYDPQNAPGWQVERANIGVDYLALFPDRAKP